MLNRTQRNREKLIDFLIAAYPDGVKTGELAERLDVTPQTVRNYIAELKDSDVKVEDEHERYWIDPANHPRRVDLSLAETWLLYLPLRRIVRANLNRHTLIRQLLQRLASTLTEAELAEQLLNAEAAQPTTVDTTFQTVVEAWQRGVYVELRYRAPDSSPMKHTVAPWWFEPAVWSDSNYLIGGLKRGPQVTPITLKLDRIMEAKALAERFERPNTDDLLSHFRAAWGIWQGDDAPVPVVLRFANRQYDRLRETHWHPTERTRVDTDGSILWEAMIAEPREMKPWIRGWGADVEVLEPRWLRSEIGAEAAQTARLYGAEPSEKRRFF
jgi:CRISPR-associated endonuclease/helicase Cas3